MAWQLFFFRLPRKYRFPSASTFGRFREGSLEGDSQGRFSRAILKGRFEEWVSLGAVGRDFTLERNGFSRGSFSRAISRGILVLNRIRFHFRYGRWYCRVPFSRAVSKWSLGSRNPTRDGIPKGHSQGSFPGAAVGFLMESPSTLASLWRERLPNEGPF